MPDHDAALTAKICRIQPSHDLHIFKPAAAIGLGHRYTARTLLADHGPPPDGLPTSSGAGMRTCADREGTSCAGYGADRSQTRQSIQNIHY